MSGGPRIVETPEGPALLVHAGPSGLVASALYRVLRSSPEVLGTVVGRVLEAHRRALVDVEERHQRGDGFAVETAARAVCSSGWVTAAEAAVTSRVTPQAVTKACRLRRIPGAEKVGGRWLIPADALPEMEEFDDDDDGA